MRLIIVKAAGIAVCLASPALAQQQQQQQPAGAERPRLCNIGPRGNVQAAYKPYGNAVFGSDGLVCETIKTTAATTEKAAEAKGKGAAGTRRIGEPADVGR
jgi:hypothetical protein